MFNFHNAADIRLIVAKDTGASFAVPRDRFMLFEEQDVKYFLLALTTAVGIDGFDPEDDMSTIVFNTIATDGDDICLALFSQEDGYHLNVLMNRCFDLMREDDSVYDVLTSIKELLS